MNALKVFKNIISSKEAHFLSVDAKFYRRWKYLIIFLLRFNKNYKSVEIYRKRFKSLHDFVVVGLKYNGKNVRRRTLGFARDFVEKNKKARCVYCDAKLTFENATTDHIIPISEGGNNSQVNLVVCCADCNNERGNTEFKYYLSKKNSKKLKQFI
jgi:CRISPR/Cas system Type II protein with McrA/HNH and RuvC-like nuclease domain